MHIFISYSSKNRTLVETLANDLAALGHDVWFDKELSGGQVWWDQILGAIRDCDLCIVALTPQSLESHACKLEYSYAAALGKPILPVMQLPVDTSLLPTTLAQVQVIDYRAADRQAGFNLSRALNKLPAARPLPDPLPQPPAAPLSPLARLRDQVEASSLNFQQQASLILELKELLVHPQTAAGARQLLVELRNRNDLMVQPAQEVDTLLQRYGAGRRGPSLRGLLAIGVALAVIAIGAVLVLQARGSGGLGAQIDLGQTPISAQNPTAADETATPTPESSTDSTATPTPAPQSSTQDGVIVYSSDKNQSGVFSLFSIRTDGSNDTLLLNHTRGYAYQAAWSPDGQHIAYTSSDNDQGNVNDEIYVMNADSSDPHNLTHNAGMDNKPAWSPDGEQIAFSTVRDNDYALYVMNADGSNLRSLSDSHGAYRDQDSSWSPDGKQIAFSSNRTGNYEIWVMNADGSEPRRLTETNNQDNTLPAWSPDGFHIAYTSGSQGGDASTNRIYMIGADGSENHRLTLHPSVSPAWSPDSNLIAYASAPGTHFEIYTINVYTLEEQALTKDGAFDVYPAWKP